MYHQEVHLSCWTLFWTEFNYTVLHKIPHFRYFQFYGFPVLEIPCSLFPVLLFYVLSFRDSRWPAVQSSIYIFHGLIDIWAGSIYVCTVRLIFVLVWYTCMWFDLFVHIRWICVQFDWYLCMVDVYVCGSIYLCKFYVHMYVVRFMSVRFDWFFYTFDVYVCGSIYLCKFNVYVCGSIYLCTVWLICI